MTNQNQNPNNQNSLGGIELTKVKRKLTQVEVEIFPSPVFDDAVKYTIMSADRIFRDSVNSPVVDFGTLRTYFLNALKHRMFVTTAKRIPDSLKVMSRDYPLPSVVYNAVRQIGEAKDMSLNVRFIPVMSKEVADIPELSKDDYEACVNMMRAMEEEGYVVSGQLARDVYGDVNFMAMTHLENQACGPLAFRDTNPVYAFYRAFFYNQELARLNSELALFEYNSIEEMSNVLKDLLFRRANLPSMTDVLEEYR